METQDKNWPAWRYGPDGASDVFDSAAEVPAGWQDHPSKVTEKPAPRPTPAATGAAPAPGAITDATRDVDAEGWPFDPALHAATRSRTQADLWRMKVGVTRPAPKPGFPKPVLDL
jgi:hypothetical protein